MVTRSGLTSERLGLIVEEAASEVYIFSARDFRFRLVNKGARDNVGYTIDELRQMTPWDLKPEFSREVFLDMVRPLQSGDVAHLEFDTVHRRKDGTDYDVSVNLQLFEDDEDPVFYAAIRDITLHLQTEAAWRNASRRLNAILDNTTMSVFLMDEQHHCVFMNKAAEDLTGYAFSETIGRPLHDVIHHTRPDGSHFPLSECAIDRAFPENAREQGEEIFVHKDGHFYPVAFTASPIHDDQSNAIGTIIEARDISEDRRLAAARDLLMHEVDHRARNVLAVVQSLTHLTVAPDMESYKTALSGRIGALARVQTSLASRRWENGRVEDVVREALSALCPDEHVQIDGPDIALAAAHVQPLGMFLHELATNANKYGACSREGGRVFVDWAARDDLLRLNWREQGGPPVTAPERAGFGSKLKSSLARQMGGRFTTHWNPDGLSVELVFPLRDGRPDPVLRPSV